MRTIVTDSGDVMTVEPEYHGLSMRRYTVRLDLGWWPPQCDLVRLLDDRYNFGHKVERIGAGVALVTVYTD